MAEDTRKRERKRSDGKYTPDHQNEK